MRHSLRNGLMMLGRARGLATVAVLTLGIAVNVAVFAVVHAVLVRPLPHPGADRLVAISSRSLGDGRDHQMAPLDFFDFEQQSASFERIAAYYPPGFTLTGAGGAERVPGARASSGIFDVFGITPALGRGFLPAEDEPGAERVAVIGHALWVRRFGSDPRIIGRSISLSGAPYTVVGVLPQGFQSPAMWPRMPEIWVPIGLDANAGRRDARMLRVLGRLRPDTTVDQARRDLERIAAALGRSYPDTNRTTGVSVTPLLEELTKDTRPSLLILVAGVAALMLVAAGNAAALIFAGTLQRRREFAIRLALGATRGRLVRALVAEHLVTGAVAAAAGFAFAYAASDLLAEVAATARVPRAAEIEVGGYALAAGALLSIACSVLCAALAGISILRQALRAGMSRDSAGVSRSHAAMNAGLVVVQAALSLALLTGAALLGRSFYQLQAVDPGFDAEHTFTTRLSPPAARYPAGPTLAAFYGRVVDRVAALPGVAGAAVVDWLPASGAGSMVRFTTDPAGDPERYLAEARIVSSGYFNTLAIPLAAGRRFDNRDRETSPHVVVVNESFATAYFGSVAGAVGRTVRFARDGVHAAEVIGVTRDVREVSRRLAPAPGVYLPNTQLPWLRAETRDLVIRTAAGRPVPAASIHAIIRDVESDAPLAPLQAVAEVTSTPLVAAELYAAAVMVFAGVAALLAAFGIYGAVSWVVAQGTRQIGIRMALGATSARVMGDTVRRGLVPAGIGLVAGIPLALGAGRVVRQQLFGVQPDDPATLMGVGGVMLAVAAAASLLPALRASRIDPAVTLRHDSR